MTRRWHRTDTRRVVITRAFERIEGFDAACAARGSACSTFGLSLIGFGRFDRGSNSIGRRL